MTTQSSTVFKRPARLKFVGQWGPDTDLTKADWRVEVRCGACGAVHRFELEHILHGVKSATTTTCSYNCPTIGVTCGLTLSGADVKIGLKYIKRAQQPIQKRTSRIPVKATPQLVDPMPIARTWRERVK